MIKRYRVHLNSVASTAVDVEVDTSALEDGEDHREAAIDLAIQENRATLCFHCASRMNLSSEWAGDTDVEELP